MMLTKGKSEKQPQYYHIQMYNEGKVASSETPNTPYVGAI